MYDRKGPDKWILENDSECDRAGERKFKQIVDSYVLSFRYGLSGRRNLHN